MTRRLIAAIALTLVAAQAYGQVCINEFRISEPGGDMMNFVELGGGIDGDSVSAYTLLSISTEFNPGEITFATPLSGMFSNGGFFVSDQNNGGADYFGSPQSFVLVDGFTGMAADDLDADDDGVFDAAVPWSSVIASVTLTDGDGDGTPDTDYGFGVLVGPDGTSVSYTHLTLPTIYSV